MDLQDRIENFKKMATDDPTNELGHFSLGKAYLDAGQLEDAEASFRRVLELKSDFSKAFQHLGEVQRQQGREQEAVATLTEGYRIAAGRGDVMPREAMGGMLKEMGAAVPETAAAAVVDDTPLDGDSVRCTRCGRVGPKLAKAPVKGPLGERIHTEICGMCWQEWMGMGTKVINELRLDFSNPQAGEIYDAHMKEFLQLA